MKRAYVVLGLMISIPLALFGSEEQSEQHVSGGAHIALPAHSQQQTQKRLVFTNAHNSPYTIYLSYSLKTDNRTVARNAEQAPCWIRRVLVPGEVLYIEETIDELCWHRDEDVNRLLLPDIQEGRVAFDVNGKFSTTYSTGAWQVPLRVRGTGELKKFFPSLWPQEPTSHPDILSSVSGFIAPFVGQAPSLPDGASHFHCQEIQERISELGLMAQQAACRILALEDCPTEEETDHAFKSKLLDLSRALQVTTGVVIPNDAIDRVVIQTVCDAKNVLDALRKEQHPCQTNERVNIVIKEALCINQTDQTVFLAQYYINPNGSAIRVPGVEIVSIPPYSEALVSVSGMKAPAGKVIEYFVAASPNTLRESLSTDTCQQHSHSSLTFSSVFSNSYYIIKNKETNILTLMPLIQYGTMYCRTFPNDPKQSMGGYDCPGTGHVHRFDNVKPETAYLQQRIPRVKAAFESFLHAEGVLPEDKQIEEDHLPQIGIAFTGGGYRSMIKAVGCCAAAEEMQLAETGGERAYAVYDHDDESCGKAAASLKKLKKNDGKVRLIDVTTYMSGLSGSTWALVSFLDAKRHYGNNLTFREFGQKLKPRVMFNKATFPPTIRDMAFYAHIIGIKSRYAMPAYDFIGNSYAYHLAKRLLWGDEDYRHYRHLSDLKNAVDATIPFPFLTAVTMDGQDHNHPTWLEFSPFHVGAHRAGGYWIDSPFFGREFLNGETTPKGMEEYLGYIMAICGSAYAANLPGISDHVPFGGYLPKPESGESVLATRMVKPTGYNFTVGLEKPMGYTASAPQGQHVVGYIDGAHDQVTVGDSKRRHNFATIPLLARGLDVIIMCDAVRELSTTHLTAAKARADYFGFPFPQYRQGGIDSMQKVRDNMQQNQATLWVDPENLDAPVIVHLAVMKDDSFDPHYDPSSDPSTHTANFWYTSEEYDKLYGLSQHVFAKAEPVIKEALKIAYERKVVRSRMTPQERAAQSEQVLFDEYSVVPCHQSVGSASEVDPEPVPSHRSGQAQALESVSSVPPAEARLLTADELCDWPDDNEMLLETAEAHAHEQEREDDHGLAGVVVAEEGSEARDEARSEGADGQDDDWDDCA